MRNLPRLLRYVANGYEGEHATVNRQLLFDAADLLEDLRTRQHEDTIIWFLIGLVAGIALTTGGMFIAKL